MNRPRVYQFGAFNLRLGKLNHQIWVIQASERETIAAITASLHVNVRRR